MFIRGLCCSLSTFADQSSVCVRFRGFLPRVCLLHSCVKLAGLPLGMRFTRFSCVCAAIKEKIWTATMAGTSYANCNQIVEKSSLPCTTNNNKNSGRHMYERRITLFTKRWNDVKRQKWGEDVADVQKRDVLDAEMLQMKRCLFAGWVCLKPIWRQIRKRWQQGFIFPLMVKVLE